MPGLVAYGSYLPHWRVDRAEMSELLGARAPRGRRAAASHDEDTTTMGVEAARLALRPLEEPAPDALFFATTEPAYLAKTNANAVHAALDLDTAVPTFDVIGGARAGVAATLAAERLGGIAVMADLRRGPAGSRDDVAGGDAAAALVFGRDDVVAELVGAGHGTREFMEQWRLPAEVSNRSSDDRFVDHVYGKLTEPAVADALKAADISASDVDHVVATGTDARAAASAARAFAGDAVVADMTDQIGFTGAAHWGVLLTGVLDRAETDQHVVVITLGDGVTVMVFRTTSRLEAYRRSRARRNVPTLADQLEADHGALPYARFLAWRGVLLQDLPVQPDPEPLSAAAAERNARWKYGLVGSRDDHGYVHLPPARVSSEGGAIDDMTPVPMADVQATVATFTVDHVAWSPAPPVVTAVVDFDDGGRMTVELTDVEAGDVRVGDRVEMTFRRLHTFGGVHDYFWKARPLRHVKGL
jgi:3-hydroxy-3-methylglutaryl CoA synthase/uncharacterized OB-fold protein